LAKAGLFTMKQIAHYFPTLTDIQQRQLAMLGDLYAHWNEQINVISRKDTENFYEHHVLHSLGISKVIEFSEGSKILDIGTGGGFPGIPLAILFPECQFTLVDSIGKKIRVVNEVKNELGLKNVVAIHERAENIEGKFDFIVSRAVTAMPDFIRWTTGKISKQNKNALKNGILYLKGGDLTEELSTVQQKITLYNLSEIYTEEFFETKKVVHVKL
jgi:16S rRNA (guanine527-N7)-methyltransferase